MGRLAALLATLLILGCGGEKPRTKFVLSATSSHETVAEILRERLARSGFGGTVTIEPVGRIVVRTPGSDTVRLKKLLTRPGTLTLAIGNQTFNSGDIDLESLEVRPVPGRSDYAVTFTLALSRAADFRAATAANVGKTIRVSVDGLVRSRPVVRAPVEGRLAVVGGTTNGWTETEARDLMAVLRTQTLPVKVSILRLELLD